MGRAQWDVLVIGAGVSGLTTAVCLAESGLAVRVRTAQPTMTTTSAAAGAIWGPHFVRHERLTRWCRETLSTMEDLARTKKTGIRPVAALEVARFAASPHESLRVLPDFRMCRPGELPGGCVTGWRYTAPVINMPIYLRYLETRLTDAGGKIDVDPVTSLEEVTTQAPIAVNCSGFGARDLVPDPDLVPIRGDLIVVDNPGIDEFYAEETGESPDLIYILPQEDQVILGGTAVHGDSNVRPDAATAEAVLRRCAAVEPRLEGLTIREHRVGVRPTRAQIRFEHVHIGRCHLIHNYGHGGAGVSLSWGCARDVLDLVNGL
jgi:D-amino-acid oxidase